MCRGIIIAFVILLAGCGQMSEMSLFNTASPGVHLLDMTGFAPAASGEGTVLRVFVQPDKIEQDLCFRFELYVYIPRSSNPRGKRIVLWPDIEVKANASSNSQWREHLKAYEFVLPMETQRVIPPAVVLEVTAMGQDGVWSDMLKLPTKVR